MDEVLEVMKRGRARYASGASSDSYVSYEYLGGGCRVCAVGAIWAEKVKSNTVLSGTMPAWDKALKVIGAIEIEALRLLDESSVELYPESSNYAHNAWHSPLEWMNQSWHRSSAMDYWPRRMKAVLRIYDHAIAKREAMNAELQELLREEKVALPA